MKSCQGRVALGIGRSIAQLLVCAVTTASGIMALQGQRVVVSPKAANSPTPQELLVRSYDIGRGFTIAERVYLLTLLDNAGVEMKFPKTAQWADEQFRLTFQLPHDWARVAGQKNALAALSAFDATRALQLMRRMDLTVAENGKFSEDLRADCARVVFVNYWQERRPKGLDRLRSEAQQLAQTGEYPYVAMAQIIESSTLKPDQVREIVEDASEAYQKGSRFEIEDRAYVYFLKAIRSRTSRDQFRRALGYAVDRLIASGNVDTSKKYTANVYTSKGTLSFANQEDSLLFDLLPLAQESDPDLVEKVLQARPQFRKVLGSEIKAGEGAYTGDTANPGSAGVRQFAIEEARVQEVATIASKDPNEALLLAQSISDASLKATALAYVAEGLQSTAPGRASQMISTLKDNANTLDPGPSKVTMLTALAEAAAKSNDTSTFEFAFQRALDLGTELFEEDAESHPSKPTYATTAFDDLGNLTKIGINARPESTLDAILAIQNDVLRAYLLIDAAEAMYHSTAKR